jgi:hypothetical protein
MLVLLSAVEPRIWVHLAVLLKWVPIDAMKFI